MDFIIVLAKITPKTGCSDSIIELSQDLIFETRQEEGNIDYQLLTSIENDDLTFIEKWMSHDDLKKHLKSPHFLNFRSESDEFIENETLEILESNEISI